MAIHSAWGIEWLLHDVLEDGSLWGRVQQRWAPDLRPRPSVEIKLPAVLAPHPIPFYATTGSRYAAGPS